MSVNMVHAIRTYAKNVQLRGMQLILGTRVLPTGQNGLAKSQI